MANTRDDYLPQDMLIDRRSFIARMSALTAATTAATVLPPVAARTAHAGFGLDNDAYARTIRPAVLSDPTEATIAEAATLIRKRMISPLELVEAYLARIEQFEGIYKAFNTVRADEARAEAAAAASARYLGPLHGIPLGIKDNYYTLGTLTTANSHIFASFVPDFDATTVAKLKAAGAIVLGKTQMGPLATTRATTPDGQVTTVNAWTPNDPTIEPGGSSSGSGCGTAARLFTSSIGTQTGGSITSPSNANGLTGLKPTMGRASLYGIVPLTYTRDHPGPLARDAKDAAIMLQAMAGPDVNDFRTQGLPPVPDLVKAATPVTKGSRVTLRWPTRVGVLPDYLTPGSSAASQAQAAARSAMLDTLASLSATIVEVPFPTDWTLLTSTAFNNVRLPERSEPFLEYLKQDVRLFGVSLNSWINGLFLGGEDYLKGQRAKVILLQQVLDEQFSQCDVIVQTSPTPFDSIGLPEIAFNIGFRPLASGLPLPIGAILAAPPFGEERLLSVVAAFQAVTDFHLQRPADPVVSLAARFAAAPQGLRLTSEDVDALTQ